MPSATGSPKWGTSTVQKTPTRLTLFFCILQCSAWLTLIGIYISAFQTTATRDSSRKKPPHYLMSWWGLILHCSPERGWATVGIVTLLKDRMRGGGMQPLIIIGPIYCEMSSKREAFFRGRALWVIAAHLILRVKVIVICTQDLLMWHWTAFSISTAFLNNNDSATNASFPSSIITVSMQNSRPPGCLMETGPVWREQEGEEEEGCVSHSGFLHTTVSLALTHNNSDTRLFKGPAGTFY